MSATTVDSGGPGAAPRASATQKYLPVVYLFAALTVFAAVLPTALRPPQPPPPTTAALSPDAPPDDQLLITQLNQGRSATAGSGFDTDPTQGGGGSFGNTKLAPPRACPAGLGNPPRQVESLYAAPCAPAFKGNNGGKTYKGVTSNQIRIGIRGPGYKCGADYDSCHSGRIRDIPPAEMNSGERTFWALERYFNQNFQFYGREVVFYIVEPNSLSIEDEQAAAVAAANSGLFGSPTQYSVGCEQWAIRKLVAFCDELSDNYYAKHDPYLWGSYMGGTEITKFAAEYWCKKLVGKNAIYAGDPTFHDKRRKFGAVTYNNRGYGEDAGMGKRLLKEKCGEDELLIYMTPGTDTAEGSAAFASAATRLKAEGVTTVVPGLDWISTAALTNAAANQGYFPEWYVCDCGALTRNQLAQLQNPAEWKAAFGLSGLEVERPNDETECYRAYHSIDPSNDPNYVNCTYQWRALVLFMSGIQGAAAKLTPQSFKKGLYGMGMRYYDHPRWVIGGGYAPGYYSYPHNVAEVWWDPTARDPQNFNGQGAYRYTFDAKRFCLGQLNSDVSQLFKKGVLLAPGDEQASTSKPRSTCPPA